MPWSYLGNVLGERGADDTASRGICNDRGLLSVGSEPSEEE